MKSQAEKAGKNQKHSAEFGVPHVAEVARQNSETRGRPRAQDKETVNRTREGK